MNASVAFRRVSSSKRFVPYGLKTKDVFSGSDELTSLL